MDQSMHSNLHEGYFQSLFRQFPFRYLLPQALLVGLPGAGGCAAVAG